MKSRGLRVALVVAAVVALAGFGYFTYSAERLNARARQAQAAFESDASRVNDALADVRAALPGYVSEGQGQDFWAERTEGLLQALAAGAKGLERPGVVPEASQEIGTLEESAVTLTQYNGRVRLLVEAGRAAEASRLIFGDINDLAMAASDALSAAVAAQRRAIEAEIAQRQRRQAYALVTASLVALAVLLLLLPRPASDSVAEGVNETESAAAAGRFSTPAGGPGSPGRLGFDLDIKPSARPGSAAVDGLSEQGFPATGEGAARRVEESRLPLTAAGPPAVAAALGPGLAEVAGLCTELAQVADTGQLRHLLGRAATLLDASGVVIWLGGVGDTRLRPAFSHGYTPQALARMPGIDREDQNAVSAAYRTGQLQVVEAGNEGSSALVMPLLAPSGCVGAMAVEVGRGAEKDALLQALGQLIAAQIATLMPTES